MIALMYKDDRLTAMMGIYEKKLSKKEFKMITENYKLYGFDGIFYQESIML